MNEIPEIIDWIGEDLDTLSPENLSRLSTETDPVEIAEAEEYIVGVLVPAGIEDVLRTYWYPLWSTIQVFWSRANEM